MEGWVYLAIGLIAVVVLWLMWELHIDTKWRRENLTRRASYVEKRRQPQHPNL